MSIYALIIIEAKPPFPKRELFGELIFKTDKKL